MPVSVLDNWSFLYVIFLALFCLKLFIPNAYKHVVVVNRPKISHFNNHINVLIFNVSFCVCEQQALQEAQEDLAITQQILNEAKEKLAAVEEGIATLQAKYHECLRKRDELDAKCQLCENRLIRADKVSGEKPSHLSNFPFNLL